MSGVSLALVEISCEPCERPQALPSSGSGRWGFAILWTVRLGIPIAWYKARIPGFLSSKHPSRDVIFSAKKRQICFLYMTFGSIENKHFWHHVM